MHWFVVGCGVASVFYMPSSLADSSDIDFSLGYGFQQLSGHQNKVHTDVTSFTLSYSAMDRFEGKLFYARNGAKFVLESEQDRDVVIDDLKLQHQGLFLAGHRYTDFLQGHWRFNIQYHEIAGDLSDPSLGDVVLTGAGFRFQPYTNRFLLDLNYSHSNYEQGIKVEQWDFGVGTLLFKQTLWLQWRQYLVQFDQNSSFEGYEILAKYWMPNEYFLGVDDIFISQSFGRRQLFFDVDTQTLWNNSDILDDFTRVGFTWDLPRRTQLLLVLASAKYTNAFANDSYRGDVAYIELGKKF